MILQIQKATGIEEIISRKRPIKIDTTIDEPAEDTQLWKAYEDVLEHEPKCWDITKALEFIQGMYMTY